MNTPDTPTRRPIDAAATPPTRPARAPATPPSRARVLPSGAADGRTRAAKRLAEIARALAGRVADPESPIARAQITAAAGLCLRAESLAHRLAAGDAGAGLELERAQHALDAAMRALGLRP